jgi:hypothetical protein
VDGGPAVAVGNKIAPTYECPLSARRVVRRGKRIGLQLGGTSLPRSAILRRHALLVSFLFCRALSVTIHFTYKVGALSDIAEIYNQRRVGRRGGESSVLP